MSTDSLNDTMNFIRRLATHLAAEPNLPDVRELTRGEIDAWIRALDADIEPRAVDLLSVPVLEILLHKQHLGIWDNPRCLARAPISHFNPVVVNPWDPDDTFYVDDDEDVYVGGNSPSSGPVADGIKHISIVRGSPTNPDVSMVDTNLPGSISDITMGEPTEPDVPEQDTSGNGGSDSDDAEVEITVLRSAAQDHIALADPEQDDAKHIDSDQATDDEKEDDDLDGETTTHRSGIPSNIVIQPEPEPQDPDNADSRLTTEESEDEDPDRELWCHCNMPQDDRAMVECNNHKDIDCRGKWYHTACAGLSRIPPEKSDWYCRDCRKKLHRGLYTNGIVG